MYYYLAYNIAIINIQLQRNANSINYVVTIFGNNKLNAYICNKQTDILKMKIKSK